MPATGHREGAQVWRAETLADMLLTNWNSVAAPAPASAFLSAPARQETGKQPNTLSTARLAQAQSHLPIKPNSVKLLFQR